MDGKPQNQDYFLLTAEIMYFVEKVQHEYSIHSENPKLAIVLFSSNVHWEPSIIHRMKNDPNDYPKSTQGK